MEEPNYMKILINTNEKTLKRISKITGIPFETMDTRNVEGAIAVAFQGVNYKIDLEKALYLDVPIVAVAGYKNSAEHKYALEAGIPDEAIIVVQGNTLVNAVGEEFTKDTNIKAKDIVKICKYIQENNIHPEIYLWKAPKKNAEDAVIWEPQRDTEQPLQDVKKEEAIDPEVRIVPYPNERTEESDKQRTMRTPVMDFIRRHKKIIALIKSDSLTNSGNTIKELATKIGGFHLEMANPAKSYQCYAETKEKALHEGNYGYLANEEAIYRSTPKGTLVLEIETDGDTLAVLEKAMPHITHIVHMTGGFEQSRKDIDSWLDMKLPIFGILPTQERAKFVSKYSSLVKNLDELAKI